MGETTSAGDVTLSAFASELLMRTYEELDDASAFGRITQTLVVEGLKQDHPNLTNNNVGTPDCYDNDGEYRWAWEIKHTSDGTISLGARDLEGITADLEDGSGKGRVIALAVDFPTQLWILDAEGIEPATLQLEAHGDHACTDEARQLAARLEEILRAVDVDLITPDEDAAKAIIEQR